MTAKVDAYSGMAPGPYTSKTITELFIDGTQPKQADDTKVGIQVEQRDEHPVAGRLLRHPGDEGLPGSRATSNHRSGRGRPPTGRGPLAPPAAPGCWAVPGPIKTRTAYFYNGAFRPYGSTWGAPFPPTKTCSTVPPSPSPSGLPRAAVFAASERSAAGADRGLLSSAADQRPTTLAPSPPSPRPPGRHSLTSGWPLRVARTASRSAPEPWPWTIVTRVAPATAAWSR